MVSNRSERSWSKVVGLGIAVLLLGVVVGVAKDSEVEPAVDPALFQSLEWRNIGPFRGGSCDHGGRCRR